MDFSQYVEHEMRLRETDQAIRAIEERLNKIMEELEILPCGEERAGLQRERDDLICRQTDLTRDRSTLDRAIRNMIKVNATYLGSCDSMYTVYGGSENAVVLFLSVVNTLWCPPRKSLL